MALQFNQFNPLQSGYVVTFIILYTVHMPHIINFDVSFRKLWLSILAYGIVGVGSAIAFIPGYSDMHGIAK